MIVIAGAGIGGLTLGCALARAGLPFVIFERAEELRAAGAGIALSQNAFAALAHLGLEQTARAAGQEMREAAICDHHGRVLMSSQVGHPGRPPGKPADDKVVEAGTVAMARADLQAVLLTALEGEVELGRAVRGYRARPGGVVVELEDGAEVKADLLVGADGLHSAVRHVMRGREPLRYAGYTSWRALVEDVDLPREDRFTESWGPGQRFGIAPIGNRRVYWFAVADAPAGERDEGDPRAGLLDRFAGWHAPIAEMIEAAEPDRILRTDIYDRPPIDRWIEGYVTLLGDAAHPMTPNLGQGGCQAIEDAVVLASALARFGDVQPALLHYQKRRLARANSFVVRSWRFGQIAHLRTPTMRWLRDRALRAIPASFTARAAARDLQFRL
jgi:2-polyprenyl-6-methoxyphenol hydroxylase-like FAD-dependent oxidoreductase